MRWAAGLVLVALTGCDDALELFEDPLPTVLPDVTEPPLGSVAITESPAPLPPWARAIPPYDSLSAGARDDLVVKACFGGDREWVSQLVLALEAESGPLMAGPWTTLLVDRCRTPSAGFCEAVAEQVEALDGKAAGSGLHGLWHIAGSCASPDVWEVLELPNAPNQAVVDYLAVQDNLWRPVPDPAAVAVAVGMLGSDDVHRAAALQGLGAVDSPEASRALLDDAAAQPDPEQATSVALWLYRQSAPEARARFERACVERPAAWQCVEGLDPLADLDTVVQTANVDLSALVGRHTSHRSAILAALERCVRTGAAGEHDQGGRCLNALVGAGEHTRADVLLRDLDPDAIGVYWATRRRAWLELGGLGIGAALAERGLLDPGPEPLDPEEPPVYVVDWFLEQQRGVNVVGRSNAQALTELLGQVPGLRQVAVATREPVGADGAEPVDELFAWVDGVRLRTMAVAWTADDRRLAAFANVVAERAGVDTRFAAVAPGQVIVWGEGKALKRLIDDGLLDVME